MRAPIVCLLVVGLTVLPLAGACGNATTGNPDAGGDGGHMSLDGGDADSGADVGVDAGSPETGEAEAEAEAGCANAVVPESVTTNMTLTLACSPWHVHKSVQVGGPISPVLRIEAGVTVLFDKGTYLQVAGSMPGELEAIGTKSLPITFTSSAAKPKAGDWGNVWLSAKMGGIVLKAGSAMKYVSVEYAGATVSPLLNIPTDNGAIIIDGGNDFLGIDLENVTVSHTGSSGIVFFGHLTGLTKSSGFLTITDWATGGYPIIIDGNEAGTLPTSITTGTGKDGSIGIITQEQTVNGGGQTIIDQTQTWPAMPIPYTIDAYGFSTGGCGLFIDGAGTTSATLTIAAPNRIEVGTPCGIYVDFNNVGQGFLVAAGTSTAPIVFASAKATPSIGDWNGIVFGHSAVGQSASQLAYCTISYADASCSAIDPNAAVWVDMYLGTNQQGPSIQNCAFDNYAANCPAAGCCGIVASSTSNASSYGSMTAGASGNTFNPGGTAQDVCTAVD